MSATNVGPKMMRAQRSTSNKACAALLEEVRAERVRQDDKWGEQNHPDVDAVLTGRPGGCAPDRMAEEYEVPTEERAKFLCQTAEKRGQCTWAHIAVEELCEAIAAAAGGDGELAVRKEVLQLAAVCVQWAAAIDRRAERRVAALLEGTKRAEDAR